MPESRIVRRRESSAEALQFQGQRFRAVRIEGNEIRPAGEWKRCDLNELHSWITNGSHHQDDDLAPGVRRVI